MAAVEITLSGCDDHTKFVVDLTDDETQLLERIATLSQEASDYGCQPRMIVGQPGEASD